MEKIADYKILKKIDETRHSLVFRAQKQNEDDTFIIKAIKAENPSASQIARFKQEYELIKRIEIDGVIKVFDIIRHGDGFALVLEDFNGVSVKSVLNEKGKLDIITFLNIAIPLSETLGLLHNAEIIHKDIKPHNILTNLETNNVKLTDFGISSILTLNDKALYNSEIIEGTLPYMSPEQTGRMNRSIDYRTDLYSLGVTFYEMLTGKRPFRSKDPMEMIHAHIAVNPEPPAHHYSEIPEVISRIIMKLISKNAEERYQSCFGLMRDLKECQQYQKKKGEIDLFELGKNDISGKFTIPEKLYGREKEIEILISTFERISKGPSEILLVKGHPGIGKSSLINEIHKPIVAKKGYFISGKYDQFQRDVPYSAIIQAFQDIIKQLLSESQKKINAWKEDLLSALGQNGKVITDLIPEVAFIIGEQPASADLSSEASKNRFNFIFEKFISVFAKEKHPIVLFLDDLQWMDRSSLTLMESILVNPGIKYLLLIGSYRDNEVPDTHPLMEMLRKIENSTTKINTIFLAPLTKNDIAHLIDDFLKNPDDNAVSLATLIHEKTGGNPFFIIQFLHTLYNEKQITFDPQKGWNWQIDTIRIMQVTDNVVDLMTQKISKLPSSMCEILKTCACMGNPCDPETLSLLIDKPISQILTDLSEIANEGLIHASSDIFIFHHDRIQEASYALLSKKEKAALHYKIGQLTLDRTDKKNHKEKLFYIVDQLNSGAELMTSQEELDNLARLNLEAGKKARMSAAYTPAARYLKTGISVLGENAWDTQYELSIGLYTEAVEAAYLNDDYDQMNRWMNTALIHAKTHFEKAKLYEIKILSYIAQWKLSEAVTIGLQVINQLGMKINEKPNKLNVIFALVQVKRALAKKQANILDDLPEITDPDKLMTLHIMSTLSNPTMIINPNLFAYLILQRIRFVLKHGNSAASSVSFLGYAVILTGIIGDIDAGIKYGQLAFDSLKKYNAKDIECRTYCVFASGVNHWKEHVKDSIDLLWTGYQIGLETGDLVFGSSSLFMYCLHKYHIGWNLLELKDEVATHYQALLRLNQNSALSVQQVLWQLLVNLTEDVEAPCHLDGHIFDEKNMIPRLIKENEQRALGIIYFMKLFINFLFYKYADAFEYAKMAKKYQSRLTSMVIVPMLNFYDSLTQLALYPTSSKPEQKQILKNVASNQKKMKKWAHHAPMNRLQKYNLVEAERSRVIGDHTLAETLYDTAIDLSRKHGYLIEEAIANELAAKFYLSRQKKKIAKTYMTDAYGCFSRWGATAKTKQLRKLYPQLLLSSQEISHDKTTTMTSTTSQSDVLDLSTVIKASQAISGELVLENLLVKMMKIAMENAGAQKGFLIRQTDDQLFIEMTTDISSDNTEMIRSMPLEHSRGLCKKVVHYVIRTGENIVLHDAAAHGEFTQDPYILENSVKSVLCTPFRYKDRIYGVFYLENNLVSHAFTKDRIELLQVLLTQSAISMENAELFEKRRLAEQELKQHRDHLEELVSERTKELETVHKELIEKAHQAGMAEIATDTLHNVGNILNSVKTSASIMQDITEKSQFEGLKKANDLLREHMDNIEDFIVNDPKGKKLLTYYLAIEEEVAHEQRLIQEHLIRLKNKIHDIEEVVDAQQNYIVTDAFTESFALPAVVDDAITMQSEILKESNIKIIKGFQEAPEITVQKSKLMHILVNLIKNAKEAMEGSSRENVLAVAVNKKDDAVYLKVSDTGKGIAPDNLKKIFAHGFTTRKDKYGFGLHSSANCMTEMGGEIWAESEGIGKGATFVLKFNTPGKNEPNSVALPPDPYRSGTGKPKI